METSTEQEMRVAVKCKVCQRVMALERFDPATRHMIVFDVLTHDSPVGWKGEKMRLFLTDTGYSKALENQEKGHIKIRNHAKVLSGDLHYDHKDRER